MSEQYVEYTGPLPNESITFNGEYYNFITLSSGKQLLPLALDKVPVFLRKFSRLVLADPSEEELKELDEVLAIERQKEQAIKMREAKRQKVARVRSAKAVVSSIDEKIEEAKTHLDALLERKRQAKEYLETVKGGAKKPTKKATTKEKDE